MLSPTPGIQQLRSAEKWAADKIGDARDRRTKRIKDAMEQAQIEIERYRRERERQFMEFHAKHMGSSGDTLTKIEIDTKAAIKQMKKEIANNHDQLIDDLLNLTYDVKPVVHRNLKYVKERRVLNHVNH